LRLCVTCSVLAEAVVPSALAVVVKMAEAQRKSSQLSLTLLAG
jgi:hypothetical protein